ncbi:uncharacterized protein V1518DRAFT_432867 [Limtongia smithiae]|uniref:uncharacterized protein n=1 Tax=Limtongia smithiae TaxID=1125753 RepID=UPI0034CF9047
MSEESAAEHNARLRRERREARVLGNGTSRLDKIANRAPSAVDTSASASVPASPAAATAYDDPPDVAPELASTRPAVVRTSSSANPQSPILKMLASTGRQRSHQDLGGAAAAGAGVSSGADSPIGGPGSIPASNTVFQDFFRQALGGGAGGVASAAGASGMPDLNGLLSALAQTQQLPGEDQILDDDDIISVMAATAAAGGDGAVPPVGSATEQLPVSDLSSYWKLAHSLAVIVIGLYATVVLGVDGTQLARIENTGANRNGNVLWLFVTVELILQSSRFIIEKGRSPARSMFTKVAGYLPMPYKSYLLLLARYTHIITNVIADFCLLLFMLGLSAIVRGTPVPASIKQD